MYFSRLLAAVGAASLFTSAVAAPLEARAMTAKQVIDNINVITSLSKKLQGPADSINILSGPLFVIGQGPFPTIITGFTQIVQTVTTDVQQMSGTQPFTVKADEDAIVAALTTFVIVHQKLLNILIGKAGLLNDLPVVGAPLAGVLRSLESIVDTFAFALIDLIPDSKDAASVQVSSLDDTIEQAIQAYTPAL